MTDSWRSVIQNEFKLIYFLTSDIIIKIKAEYLYDWLLK